ncbi:FAD-dependent oxidoreductase [Nocardioides anomalus]|uniref:FAD-dependent oxidoreductase n=1 Tax=Nocardioides anomalus TaxID=2712223 RepID=A0A6G6W8T9_9ACTN|nr:NAD(P)/FAD-dependent oxidoreductase [Nocardioides anomalus]QIG41460.1 FAD-dependent oxidoreductase [Nocardioides anomalus]
MTDADVVVVGAGLAGLRCASDLTAAGRHVVVLEAGYDVGGRVRTDHVDGFLVDRGFQLLNPAYPAVREGIDVAALELQQFEAGVVGRVDDGLVSLGHPLHAPRLLPGSARVLARRRREALALTRWARPLLHAPGTPLASHLRELSESGALPATVAQSLDGAGVHGTLRRVVEGFLSGTLLERDGDSAAAFALLLVASFLKGTPGLPAQGMHALPLQLAATAGDIRLETPVAEVEAGGPEAVVRTADGGRLTASAVVVAADGPEAARLVDVPAPDSRGVVTAWYAADQAPSTRLLHVDARERPTGPAVNAAVVSAAAPTYAPPGRHLLEASAVVTPGGDGPSLAALRAHAAELLGTSAAGWEVVAVHEVPHALPAQRPPFRARRPVRLERGLYVCGDHRDTASIQGALVSGRRTAAAVIADL